MIDRANVLAAEEAAWRELTAAVATVPVERRDEEGVLPGWSAHDTVWHTTYWVERAADVLDLARQGPPYPDEPEDLAYYDQENDRVFATGRALSWEELLHRLAEGRGRARDAFEGCADSDLPWMGERLNEEIEHFREHAAQIRGFLEASRS